MAFEQEDLDNQRRNATIKTLSYCEFAILSRYEFMRVLRRKETKKINNKVAFLQKIPVFERLSYTQIRKLTAALTINTCSRQQFVFRQHQKPGKIYIVIDGDFEILREKKKQYKMTDPTKINKS